MKAADPFSRSLRALVAEATGVVSQLSLLEPDEVAALKAAGVEPATTAPKLSALATAGSAALRRSALLRGRLAAARLEVKDVAAEGYGWILQARRALSDARDEETDPAMLAGFDAVHGALRSRNNRAPTVLADLDRAAPLLPDARRSAALVLEESQTSGQPTRRALRAAIAAAAEISEQRSATTREMEGVRRALRAALTRVVPRWKKAADTGRIRALMVQVCVARPRRARPPTAAPISEKTNKEAPPSPPPDAQAGQNNP